MFQNDLNECIFVYVHGSEAIQKRDRGRVDLMGTMLCLAAFCVPFFFVFLSSYFYFFTEPFTS